VRWYLTLLAAVAGERAAELVVARRNRVWSRRRGGVESGAAHYWPIVALHAGLIVGAATESTVARRAFRPGLGWPMLTLVAGSQALRWWCIATLGHRWNTRIIVVPGMALVTTGPYRWLRHPNYLAVVIEGAALPLVRSAWVTAAAFTVCNAALLVVRIRAEDAALAASKGPEPSSGASGGTVSGARVFRESIGRAMRRTHGRIDLAGG
jgi:methyltransferase